LRLLLDRDLLDWHRVAIRSLHAGLLADALFQVSAFALERAPIIMTTPQEQAMRDEFEAWAKPRGFDLRKNEMLGHYSSMDTFRAWEGWKGHACLSRPAVAQPEDVREQLAKAKADERHIYQSFSTCDDERRTLSAELAAARAEAATERALSFRDQVAQLEAERDSLRAEVERLRPNARRYEWLQSEHERTDPICHLSWKRNGDRSGSEWVNTSNLDKSIDLAIEAANGAPAQKDHP
jgi:hypothetical protein